MLVEQRIYDINPGTPMQEFLDAYEKLGLPHQKRILEGFLGYFTTEFGTLNQVRHFWAFADLEDRRMRRAALAADAGWQECIRVVRPMIVRWENTIMYPTSFSPIRSLPVEPAEPLTAFTYGDAPEIPSAGPSHSEFAPSAHAPYAERKDSRSEHKIAREVCEERDGLRPMGYF